MNTNLQTLLRQCAGDGTDEAALLMRRAADRIDTLIREQAQAEREFQREARDIAAELRWQGINEERGEPYGTY